jgi:hypothetical protein
MEVGRLKPDRGVSRAAKTTSSAATVVDEATIVDRPRRPYFASVVT